VFEGRRREFVPEIVAVERVVENPLKRKRDEDEDGDLYSNGEKSSRGEQSTSQAQPVLPVSDNDKTKDETEWLLFLVGQKGSLQVCSSRVRLNQIRRLSDLEIIFQCNDFAALPRILSQTETEETRKTAMTVEEILIANLGDTHSETHLLVPSRINILT
jgi:hypothetical protein